MRSTLVLSLAAVLPVVLAVTQTAGPPCTGTYTPCSFKDMDGDMIYSTCAPNGYCADNGAICENDNQCYNYCGTDSVCGGVGAMCDTTKPFKHNQAKTACYTPTDVCSGIYCAKAASGQRVRRQAQLPLWTCPSIDETACAITRSGVPAWECVNTQTSLEQCGGCGGRVGGVDCSEIPDVASVSCQAGACIVESCLPGFLKLGNTCV